MLREDFTFPIITTTSTTNNKVTYLAEVAPSLWRISSLEVHPNSYHLQVEVINGRKGFSTARFSEMAVDANYQEDKMDMLWEDFNDDEMEEALTSNVSLNLETHNNHHQECCNEEDHAREILYQPDLKMSNEQTRTTCSSNALMVSQKRNKMILLFKVLMKKLLLLHNMGSFKKHRS
ncbi:OLC1v1008540C1 [Oldenlandia corymbosa var. corymbosa]|uniref:OLC1v1008540C1 n=1 Tax=Oldenlandia corymbosa var. corymbosa TaxID=529605 RepID=A0AAV1DNC5_OLDCO|nr:OLC1v1008540C1 [Oldenlandia corymbosa var. corymbosa]